MLNLPPSVRIWLATRATDLRKSFDTLAELVRQQLQADPHSGHLFVFRNKRADRIKLSEAERICQRCGQQRVDIGVDKSEQLDYRPASLFVIEHIVHKYVCPVVARRPSRSRSSQPMQVRR